MKKQHNQNNTENSSSMESLLSEVEASGLGQWTIGQLLTQLIQQAAIKERGLYLENKPSDKANGFYSRNLSVGSMPLNVFVPRVRSGEFRPEFLPNHYQRSHGEDYQQLLLSMLASSKSKNAAKESIRRMGLSYSEEQVDAIVADTLESFKLGNTKPLESDMIGLFIDAKPIDVKEGHVLKSMTIYTAIGFLISGHKRLVLCLIDEGRESLEGWKKLLRNLLDRGLRRVLMVVQDDFSGLSKLTQSLFPQSKVQLCTVHMRRNVVSHLNKEDSKIFNQRLQCIFQSFTQDQARLDFENLCQEYQEQYPTFIESLLKKKDHYLHFLEFPKKLQPTFLSTNPIEIINRTFEKIRLNNSGYFQSKDDLEFKFQLSIENLHNGSWKNPSGGTQANLDALLRIFNRHFEELNS